MNESIYDATTTITTSYYTVSFNVFLAAIYLGLLSFVMYYLLNKQLMSSDFITLMTPQYFVIEMDGRGFYKLGKRIMEQYKDNINKTKNDIYSMEMKRSMIYTCNTLMYEFKPLTIYTVSDKIYLYFSVDDFMFGDYTKLTTAISSFASNVFTKYLECELRNKEIYISRTIPTKLPISTLRNPYKCSDIFTFVGTNRQCNSISADVYDNMKSGLNDYIKKYVRVNNCKKNRTYFEKQEVVLDRMFNDMNHANNHNIEMDAFGFIFKACIGTNFRKNIDIYAYVNSIHNDITVQSEKMLCLKYFTPEEVIYGYGLIFMDDITLEKYLDDQCNMNDEQSMNCDIPDVECIHN